MQFSLRNLDADIYGELVAQNKRLYDFSMQCLQGSTPIALQLAFTRKVLLKGDNFYKYIPQVNVLELDSDFDQSSCKIKLSHGFIWYIVVYLV